MKTKVRPAFFLVGAVGFVCLGYAFAFGVEHGFSFSWDGNWDPVVVGLVGLALVMLAATASAVMKQLGAGRHDARSVLRALAVSVLAFTQFFGVFLAAWGIILFLAFENAGQSGLPPLGVTLVGIVANRISAMLLPFVRTKKEKKETFVSTEDHDET